MDTTQGKCPDCSLDNQNSHQMLFKSSDGKGRCMNCRATFERNLAAEDRDTKTGVPKTPAKARVSTKPAVQRKAMIPEAEFIETVRGCFTVKEAALKLRMLEKSVKKRCVTLGIAQPGEGVPEPPVREKPPKLAPEADTEVVAPENVRSALTILRYAEVSCVFDGLLLAVRHPELSGSVNRELLEVHVAGDVWVEPQPGVFRKVAELIYAHGVAEQTELQGLFAEPEGSNDG